jgi:arsenite-transporting ATPase
VSLKFDREVLEELMTLTPPGLDELMALARVMEYMDENKFDIYVLDAPATGHLLRFLEMPHLVRKWLKAIFKLLIKNKRIIRLNALAEEMLDLSKKVRKIQEVLADTEKCRFIAVALAEVMVKSELDDLLENLKRLDVPCGHILINMVQSETECGFCELKRKEQIKIIRKIVNERVSEYGISQIKLLPYSINGMDRLNEFSEKIYA